ncbi:TMM42 protein, partial [Atractosteus spatula]|nr:TMM42 protein [Atractosteus spatula]
MFPGVIYALLAGFLGAVASSSAKLSLGADYLKGVCETGLKTWAGDERHFRRADDTTACDWRSTSARSGRGQMTLETDGLSLGPAASQSLSLRWTGARSGRRDRPVRPVAPGPAAGLRRLCSRWQVHAESRTAALARTSQELMAPLSLVPVPVLWLHIPLRLVCGGLLFTCNAVMWTFFAKALRYSSSSARATVTTTASNFISSAFLGQLIFGETHAVLWWVGISLTLSGLLVLHRAAPRPTGPAAVQKDE